MTNIPAPAVFRHGLDLIQEIDREYARQELQRTHSSYQLLGELATWRIVNAGNHSVLAQLHDRIHPKRYPHHSLRVTKMPANASQSTDTFSVSRARLWRGPPHLYRDPVATSDHATVQEFMALTPEQALLAGIITPEKQKQLYMRMAAGIEKLGEHHGQPPFENTSYTFDVDGTHWVQLTGGDSSKVITEPHASFVYVRAMIARKDTPLTDWSIHVVGQRTPDGYGVAANACYSTVNAVPLEPRQAEGVVRLTEALCAQPQNSAYRPTSFGNLAENFLADAAAWNLPPTKSPVDLAALHLAGP